MARLLPLFVVSLGLSLCAAESTFAQLEIPPHLRGPEEGGSAEAGAAAADAEAEPEEPDQLELAPALDAEYAAFEARLQRAVEVAQLGLQFNDTDHIRFLARPATATARMRDVRQLEEMIAEQFPEPLKSSVDPRAANIVLIEHRSDWNRWVRALFAEYERDGYQFQGQDVLQRALDSDKFHLEGVFCMLLDNKREEEIRRLIAFCVGYHYYNQLTLNRGPGALATGFGDCAEQALLRSPTVMVYGGYTDRQLGIGPASWANIVRQRFAEDRIPSLEAITLYSTTTMQEPQYAEGWSLVGLLTKDPEKFSELVVAIREGADPQDAILEIYEVDEEELRQEWQQFAARGE